MKITNNILHTTAVVEKSDMYSATITLTAEEGYTITKAEVTYSNGFGQKETSSFTIQPDGTTATWSNDDMQTSDGVVLNGTTTGGAQPELNVTNEIANTTETHTYENDTATIQVTGNGPQNYRFIDPKVNYTDKTGSQKSVEMQVTENSVANCVITDIDPSKPVTITGKFTAVTFIKTSLSNCTLKNPLPDYVEKNSGYVLDVALQANENTEFSNETGKIPYFKYDLDAFPTYKYFDISTDKKTATSSLTLGNTDRVEIYGECFPVSVVGGQYGAINVYLVTLENLDEFSKQRYFEVEKSDESTGQITYVQVDLGDYVNNIIRIYTTIKASSTDVIRCGNYNTKISCFQPEKDKITLDFGNVTIPNHNKNNVDFESDVQMFLPFLGFVNISNEYAGKTINLQYVVNIVTGNASALLSCNSVVFQLEQIELKNNLLFLSQSQENKTIGKSDWNERLFYGLEPYILIKWYNSVGNGLNNDRKSGNIGSFTGFSRFDDIEPISTTEMLTDEQKQIYTLLNGGVYVE